MTKAKRKKKSSRARLRKVALMCYLEPEQVEALRLLSEQLRQPVQFFVRQGVDHVRNQYRRLLAEAP